MTTRSPMSLCVVAVFCLSLALLAPSPASAAPKTCKVCTTLQIRNVTTQGAITYQGCTSYVANLLNNLYVTKVASAATKTSLTLKCVNDPQSMGLSIQACSGALTDAAAILTVLDSFEYQADGIYKALLPTFCPEGKAQVYDYVKVKVGTVGDGCTSVNRTQDFGFAYCGSVLQTLSTSQAAEVVPSRRMLIGGPTTSAVPVPGYPYCQVCFVLTDPLYAMDPISMAQQLSSDLTGAIGNLYMFGPAFLPFNDAMAFSYQPFLSASRPPYSVEVCASGNYYNTKSPTTGMFYHITADYLTEFLSANVLPYFLNKYQIGCQTNAGITKRSLYWFTQTVDYTPGGPVAYPAIDPLGNTMYCAAPGYTDGGRYFSPINPVKPNFVYNSYC